MANVNLKHNFAYTIWQSQNIVWPKSYHALFFSLSFIISARFIYSGFFWLIKTTYSIILHFQGIRIWTPLPRQGYPCPGRGILPSRRTPMPGQGYSSLKKNAHARAVVFFFSRRRNTPAGAGIYLPPGGYPCPGMEIHARASIVLDWSWFYIKCLNKFTQGPANLFYQMKLF